VRISTSPKGMIFAATSGAKRVLKGMGRLIHRSAWKVNSPTFDRTILHRTPPECLKRGFSGSRLQTSWNYIW
jgi:hypothetical protein